MNLSLHPGQIRPSISKCVTNTESELKYKHVRMLLLHTHHPDHYVIIWENFIILSRIKVNSVAAFKFCNLLHRLLREGSPEFLSHSERCLFVLKQFEKDWMSFVTVGQLDTQGYLLSSVKYCHYIMDKIAFHAKYKHVSGTFSVQNVDMMSMLDKSRKDGSGFSSMEFTSFTLKLLEGIVDVQNLIFANINLSTAKPETISCRILALVPIIEDAKKLYFLAVQSVHYLYLHTTYGAIQQLEMRLTKVFPGIRNFFMRCKNTLVLDGKVWIPQIPDVPPKFTKTVDPPRTLLHSISEQPIPSTPSTPTLRRNVSSRIAALQKTVIIPRNKIDVESKPLPPIPSSKPSTSNNRQVYESDENIYEELNPVTYDDEYFTDSDFDTTDDDEDEEEAAKYKFNHHYESSDLENEETDPRAMLQRVLLLGVQKEAKSPPVQNHKSSNFLRTTQTVEEETYEIPEVKKTPPPSPKTVIEEGSEKSSFGDFHIEPCIEIVDVASLMRQIKSLEHKVEILRRNNDLLTNENRLLQNENTKLKAKPKPGAIETPSIFYEERNNNGQAVSNFENSGKERPSPFLNENGKPKNLRESVMFFESLT
ncbi:HIP1.2 family protein [Megaselia abdita]